MHLFRRVILFIFLIATIAVLMLLFGMHLFSINLSDAIQTIERDEKTVALESFVNRIEDELDTRVFDNAVWQDLFDNIQIGNEEWLKNNVTEYMYNEAQFNLDYLYIENGDGSYTETYGDLDWFVKGPFADWAKITSAPKAGYFVRGGQLIYLTTHPIRNVDQTESSGWLVLGRNVSVYLIDRLASVYGSDRIDSIQFIHLKQSKPLLEAGNFEVAYSFPLENNQEPMLIVIHLSFKNITDMLHSYGLSIALVIIGVAIIALGVIFYFIRMMDLELKAAINNIKRISKGQYFDQLEASNIHEIDQLSISVNALSENIRQQQDKIEKSYFEGIQTLVKTLEMVDSYTKGHSERVSFYAVELARYLKWEEEDIERIRLAALMHDIGKIGIPSSILNTAGKLTQEEFDIIKTHPIIGYDILSISDMFVDIKEIIKYHHERYDGNGYPMNLHGVDIPLGARLLCVVDSFDAMTSNRSYRQAMTVEESIGIVKSESGKQFDPQIVLALVVLGDHIFEEAGKIFRHT